VGLEVPPDRFVGVQLGRIGRQIEEPQATLAGRQEAFDCGRPVSRMAITIRKIGRWPLCSSRRKKSTNFSPLSLPSTVIKRIKPWAEMARNKVLAASLFAHQPAGLRKDETATLGGDPLCDEFRHAC